MAPRIPTSLASATSAGCGSFVQSFSQRFAAPLSSSARLANVRYPANAGSSMLRLDETSAPSGRADSFVNPNPNAPAPARRSPSDASEALSQVLFNSEVRQKMFHRREIRKQTTLERMQERKTSDDYLKQMPRKWTVGELYAPKDLSAHQANEWRQPRHITVDAVDTLGLNPIEEYRNFSMISEYVSSAGMIRHSRETGLRPGNQRRMAKAIRRAIGLGIHPSVYKHPELLAQETSRRYGKSVSMQKTDQW